LKLREFAEVAVDRTLVRTVILGMLATADAGSACAAQWTLDNDWSVNLDSTVSFGVAVRTSKPNCGFLGNDNGGCVGDAPTPLQLSNPAVFSSSLDALRLNQDDGNLNYKRWQPVSTNAQWTGDLYVKATDGWSGLLRGVVNYDFAANHTQRFIDSDAKDFALSNPRVLDAYVTNEFEVADQQARIRVGNQVLSWGEDLYIPGGVNSINSIYLPSAHQPGTPLKNLFIPAPMISASSSLGSDFGIEGFYQWKWNGFVFDAPGTFFSTSDFLGKGGRGLFFPTSSLNAALAPSGIPPFPNGTIGDTGTTIVGINPATGRPYNRQLSFVELANPNTNPAGPLIGTGTVIPRGADNRPTNDGQGGLALRYKFPDSGNELGLYYYRYSDKVPFATYQVVNTAANPFGWQASLDYGKHRDLFGASYNFQAGEWAIGTELSYRPRDGVAIDPTTVIDPTSPYYCNALADFTVTPVGTTCRGWIDTQHYQFHLTGIHILSPSGSLGWLLHALGATEGTITAETALAYYPKLKLDAGIPYAVTPDYTKPTKLSAGMVLAASVTYPNVFGTRASLSPDIALSQGLSGYSATALPGFIQGAGAAVIGATIDFKTKPGTKMRVDFTHNWGGGASNLLRDRDFLTVSITSSF
jgi:hypothetical protein